MRASEQQIVPSELSLTPFALANRTEGEVTQVSQLWRELARGSTASARALMAYELAQKICVLPLAIIEAENDEPFLTALFAEPVDPQLLREVKFHVGLDVVPESVGKEILHRAIHAAYQGESTRLADAVGQVQDTFSRSIASESLVLSAVADCPIPRLLTAVFDRAIALNASDVHLEPTLERYRIRFRVDGILREETSFNISLRAGEELIRRLKVLAALDPTKRNEPQEGALTHQAVGLSIRARISTIAQLQGEKAVIRLLDEKFIEEVLAGDNRATSFSALGLDEDQIRSLVGFLGCAGGSILLSGPTGSGKSTLLYTMVSYLNNDSRNIVSIEDPVERRIPGVNQIEVNRSSVVDFAEILKPVLRQDPDVLMIGEIRDRKTARIALGAGITGHLVLSTVHAGNCLEIVSRLLELGASGSIMAMSLRLLVSQRLVAKNCPHCAEKESASPMLVTLFDLPKESLISRAKGCSRCRNSGIDGRAAVFEMLPVSEPIRQLLFTLGQGRGRHEMLNLGKLRKTAIREGYRSYAVSVRVLLTQGLISPTQALRVLGISPELVGYD